MKNLEIVNKITFAAHKAFFKVKKHSPEILITAGVIGTVASAVMACKATTKLSDILEDSKEQINQVHNFLEDDRIPESKYSKEDGNKDLAIIYAQTGIKLVKLYAPAVALGALSITGIVASNNILRKRNIALAAAYTTVDKTFKRYRNNVIDRFGENIDKELRYGIKAREIEEIVVDDDGNEKTVKKTVEAADPVSMYSDYAKIYDAGCNGWTKDAEFNLMFLRHTQAQANDILKRRGYLFLNEVYDMLGFQRTKAGQVMGWIYDEENPIGDNFVDFGIYNTDIEKARDFVNGIERVIILDFNVTNILDNF